MQLCERLTMTNKKGTTVLSGQMSFDRSPLIRRDGIELESIQLNEGALNTTLKHTSA